jgi:hypothetical protein
MEIPKGDKQTSKNNYRRLTMKKLIAILVVVLLSVSMAVSAYAQGAPETDLGSKSNPNENAVAPDILGEDVVDVPRLADGVQGNGTIDAPDKYWEMNGYPDNISFAFGVGGELLDDGTRTPVDYWEIGIINADNSSRQEILDLVSPNCLVIFKNCTYSYNQREAAFNEISTTFSWYVRMVGMPFNSELIFVEIADGYEKEYAQKYIEQYGAFVVVTNDVSAAMAAAEIGGGRIIVPFAPDLSGNTKNGFNLWLWTVGGILLLGTAAILFANRTRFIPAMQTTSGNIVTGNAPVSKKQTIAAIKNSAITPSDDVFNSIMEKIEKAQK